jgi:hypothetical protein
VTVDGLLLEAELELDDGGALLWLTDDSPYEEGLHVYLLDSGGELEDALEAGAHFTPGVLKILRSGEDWVEFRFFPGDSIHRLELMRRATFRLRLPAGWRYKRLLRKHRLRVQVAREVA